MKFASNGTQTMYPRQLTMVVAAITESSGDYDYHEIITAPIALVPTCKRSTFIPKRPPSPAPLTNPILVDQLLHLVSGN